MAVYIFNQILSNTYNAACPTKTKSITKKRLKNGWLKDDFLKARKPKDKLYKGLIKGLILKNAYNNFKLKIESDITK